MKKLILPAFVIMALLQWAVPVKLILNNQTVLSEGEVYKFRTQPIDPSDPFRGKYVTLRFTVERFETDTVQKFTEGQEVYAALAHDPAGFVKIKALYAEQPDPLDNTILKTTIGYTWIHDNKQLVSMRIPFNRFYVEESMASDAEQAYWMAQADSTQVTYALVKVRKGYGVIENVMINGRPILQIVKEMNESKK